MHHLSKSRLISAWQCAKRLWLEINDPDEKIVTPDMQITDVLDRALREV
jgi:hypothetical protein